MSHGPRRRHAVCLLNEDLIAGFISSDEYFSNATFG